MAAVIASITGYYFIRYATDNSILLTTLGVSRTRSHGCSERLERLAGKLARAVLRGGDGGNAISLLDVKKFKEELSLACRGRMIRNQHLRPLLRLLWYGLVEEARRYLEAIPTDDLKDAAPIIRLQGYLERNEGSIPCYALRSQLGLRNASSPVESANNEVTARRQKRNGMSWSKPGSHALTALSVLVCNRCHERWVREHTIPLAFVDEAA